MATISQGQQTDKLVANPLQQAPVDQKTDEQEEMAVGPLDADELRSLLDEVNSTLYSMNRALRFELHDQTEEVVVRVVNTKTDEVVRQYPSEEVLARRARLIEGDTSFFNMQVD
ncbi:flagellar protein FlaG [Marinospirillum sp. MEB164]|uniref:Flagellar protein FlaG n=1 Tax=Marinospirillum alkalitolerans TaxID=3123374 RepID=A0ABW8PXU7_9GAMM